HDLISLLCAAIACPAFAPNDKRRFQLDTPRIGPGSFNSADWRRGCGVGFARRFIDHGPGEIGDAGKAALGAPLFEPVDDGDDARWIAENEIADHDRARAGEHVFDHILDLDDAAAADDRDLHRLGALIDHAHDDRLDARSREAAELVADRRPETVDVDLEAENGVRHHQR